MNYCSPCLAKQYITSVSAYRLRRMHMLSLNVTYVGHRCPAVLGMPSLVVEVR